MTAQAAVTEVRAALERFQQGYTRRDFEALDEFMDLFSADPHIELIGIGASLRGGDEWFQGHEQVREIVESDWRYWGDVVIDVDGAVINLRSEVAWLSTSGKVVQTGKFDEALVFYLDQMKTLLENPDGNPQSRLMEATHYGMRRLREAHLGHGHAWAFVLTAVLVHEGSAWRFHTLHWSMPVD